MTNASTGTILVKAIRIVLVALVLVYIIANKKVSPTWYGKWAMIFLILNIFLIKSAFNVEIAKSYTLSLLYVLIVNVLICQYTIRNKIFDKIFIAMIIGATLEGLIVFLKYGFFVFLSSRFGAAGSANSIGLYSAFAFSLCIYSVHTKDKNKSSIPYYLLMILNSIIVILSASRKAILFLLLPLVVFYFGKSSNPIKVLKNSIVIFLILISSYLLITKVPVIYDFVGNRIESMLSGFQGGQTDSSTSTRMYLIKDGWNWFKKKPFLGNGPSNYRALHANQYKGNLLYAHNNYIELLVDIGIIGTVIYYLLYLKITINIIKSKVKNKKSDLIIVGIFISIIIGEIGLVTYYDAYIQLLLMTILLYFDNQRKIGEKNVEKQLG